MKQNMVSAKYKKEIDALEYIGTKKSCPYRTLKQNLSALKPSNIVN